MPESRMQFDVCFRRVRDSRSLYLDFVIGQSWSPVCEPRGQTPGIAFLSGLRSRVSTRAITSAAPPRTMKNDDCFQMDQ